MVEDEQKFLTLKYKKKDRDPRNHLETIRRINKITAPGNHESENKD